MSPTSHQYSRYIIEKPENTIWLRNVSQFLSKRVGFFQSSKGKLVKNEAIIKEEYSLVTIELAV